MLISTKTRVKALGRLERLTYKGLNKVARPFFNAGNLLNGWATSMDLRWQRWHPGQKDTCDTCGALGATYILGDFLCDDCFQKYMRERYYIPHQRARENGGAK